jgi:predicted Rossmann fold flavoprotein
VYDLIVIGGGAAGFYGAIHAARMAPGFRVAIFEKSPKFLSKVRISGGGRCNVTHRPMDPEELAGNYPRGNKELIGPFYVHGSADVVSFFESMGIPLKIEPDGRVFPESNRSETVIDALLAEAGRLGIELYPSRGVTDFREQSGETVRWEVRAGDRDFSARNLLLAPGSSRPIWRLLKKMGCRIVSPVPSLFTFRIQDDRLEGLQGISTRAEIELLPPGTDATPAAGANMRKLSRQGKLTDEGPMLITHWGLSGPAVLRLSAWGARHFAAVDYRFNIRINWLPDYHKGGLTKLLQTVKAADGGKVVSRSRALPVPGRLWQRLVRASGVSDSARWAEVSRAELSDLAGQLSASIFKVNGKSTFKEEFVTAGGLSLKEIDFKSFQIKKYQGLFAAGEILDIDAVTGGFNFQNAWTGSYLAACEMTSRWRNQPSTR